MYAGAIVWLWLCALPLVLRVTVTFFLVISGLIIAVSHGWRTAPGACVGLEPSSQNSCRLLLRRGDVVEMTLAAEDAFVSPALIVLCGRVDGRGHVVLVPRDGIESNAFRLLRIWLRRRPTVAA